MGAFNYEPWVYSVLTIGYIITIFSCIVVILSERRNPIKSLAWVIALIFLPVVGLIVYLFFGRSLKNVRMISRRYKRKLLSKQSPKTQKADIGELDSRLQQISRLAENLSGYMPRYASSLKIFHSGKEKFQQLKADLLAARHSIYLQYYIFSDDNLGSQISQILIDKARQGLQVRVLYDHIGSFSVKSKFFEKMRNAGVQAHPFFRVSFPHFANRVNWRNHRKIVIIDNTIGYIGGMNIADRYVEGTPKGVWRDTHIKVEGPIIADMLYSFAVDWNFLKTKKEIAPIQIPETPKLEAPTAKIPIQMVSSGPTDRWGNIAQIFHKAILAAQKSIYIQTPYFMPTDFLLKALQTAALSGIDVRLLIPMRSDSRLLSFATYSYIGECLQSGIKIYLYKPGMLHAKNMIIDNDFVTSGSANFDFRSFEHNFEANLLIFDANTNAQMKQQFFDDIRRSAHITLSTWRRRPQPLRIAESIMRLIAPIL